MHKVLLRLKKLKSPLRKLRGSYGDIVKRVGFIKEELNVAQLATDLDPLNSKLLEDLAYWLQTYQQARLDEVNFLKQRAKVQWLKEGDGNTKYFHRVVKEKRARGNIRSITNNDNIVFFDEEVNDVFLDHFKHFLGERDLEVDLAMGDDLFTKKLSLSESLMMIRPITDKEIRDAIFQIGNDKAPGSDGFSAKFFKKAWEVIGGDIQVAIHNFFYSARMPKEINHTLLCLIPKVPNASKVSDFCPISCCSVLYKCISKIVSERMKPFLDKLVSSTQSAFIPGRRTYLR